MENVDLERLVRDRAGPKYDALPLATNYFTGEVIDFTYDVQKPIITPHIVSSAVVENDSDKDVKQTFAETKQTTNTSSWTLSRTVSFGYKLSVNGHFGFGGVGAEVSMTLSTASSKTETTALVQTWVWTEDVIAPPRCRLEVDFIVNEAAYNVPFHCKVRYVGKARFERLDTNDKLVWQYDLGSLFRDFPDPSVRVIDTEIIEVDIEGTFTGLAGINRYSKIKQFDLVTKNAMAVRYMPSSVHDVCGLASGDDTIGAADGISYVVISTREVNLPNASCGFNDLGLANAGIYSIETRGYTEHRNGDVVRTWNEDVQTFLRCDDNP